MASGAVATLWPLSSGGKGTMVPFEVPFAVRQAEVAAIPQRRAYVGECRPHTGMPPGLAHPFVIHPRRIRATHSRQIRSARLMRHPRASARRQRTPQPSIRTRMRE